MKCIEWLKQIKHLLNIVFKFLVGINFFWTTKNEFLEHCFTTRGFSFFGFYGNLQILNELLVFNFSKHDVQVKVNKRKNNYNSLALWNNAQPLKAPTHTSRTFIKIPYSSLIPHHMWISKTSFGKYLFSQKINALHAS